MYNIFLFKNVFWKQKKRLFFLVALFSLFLSKYSLSFGGDGLSANYSFILFPILMGISKRKFIIPSIHFRVFIFFFSLIFIIATACQIWYIEFFLRRLISFVLFISIFIFLFIEVTDEMVRAFELALIFMSVMLSLQTSLTYIQLGGAALGYEAKDIVGSQRYGFVYVVSIWVLFFQNWKQAFNVLKFVFALIIFAGILLTFSRSSIVALVGSASIYILVNFLNSIRKSNFKSLARHVFIVFFTVIALIAFNIFYPEVFEFFNVRLFSFFADREAIEDSIDNPESSEGYRLYILKIILNYVLRNPITGSGFLGVWILFPSHSGSAHSQYTDILFRTGIIGLLIYLIILFMIGRFLYKKYQGLFWGYIGIIIYGFFHETFKESQGGFILAFLIGMLNKTRLEQKRRLQATQTDGIINSEK